MNDKKARFIVEAAVIGAIYVVLTVIFAPISFGEVQVRFAEALTVLPFFTASAVPGLFVGCLLANLLGGGVWFDVVLGSIATLLGAIFTYRWREKPLLAAFSPVLFNGLIVGPVVYFAYVRAPGDPVSIATLLFNMATVALGE
ncbi:MAG: QueT transporter family protein, partial [Blautia sp.]|nr:QueT transporter family protein [Blautia sp.]